MRAHISRPVAAAIAVATATVGLMATPAAAGSGPITRPGPYSVPAGPESGTPECYTAAQLQRAYGVDRLHERGITGKGATIAILMPYTHPTVQQDLDAYSDANGLPRSKVEVIERGDVPAPDLEDVSEYQYMHETNTDLQMIHAMAPEAKLVLVSTPEPLAGGTQGWHEISDAMTWLVNHRQVDAISMSYGVYEDQLAEEAGEEGDYHLVHALRKGLRAAARQGVTLLAASGNTGPTGPNLAGDALYSHRSVPWPASDPLVTGVGATDMRLSESGDVLERPVLWEDAALGGASGAGRSNIWPWNSTADALMVGGGESRVCVHSSVSVYPNQEPGETAVAGTSVSAPLMAGLVANAVQQAGHRIGNIAWDLARIRPGTHGTQDIRGGDCNTLGGVDGYCTTRGRDTASGIGTVRNATKFTRTLAH